MAAGVGLRLPSCAHAAGEARSVSEAPKSKGQKAKNVRVDEARGMAEPIRVVRKLRSSMRSSYRTLTGAVGAPKQTGPSLVSVVGIDVVNEFGFIHAVEVLLFVAEHDAAAFRCHVRHEVHHRLAHILADEACNT